MILKSVWTRYLLASVIAIPILILFSPLSKVFAEPPTVCGQRFIQSPSTFADNSHVNSVRKDPQIKSDPCGIAFAEMRSQLNLGGETNLYWIDKLKNVKVSAGVTNAPIALHSDPTATRKLFLNFDAISISPNSWWYGYWNNITSMQGFSLDADFSTFTDAENTYIQKVWSDVAEDFAGLDVDVTTEDPGVAGLTRSNSSDTYYGMTSHISSDYNQVARCGCGGVAYMSQFDAIWNTSENYAAPVWSFASHSRGYTLSPNDTAGIVSHELGHSVGLDHDGTSSVGYYGGHENNLWAPIMGTSYGKSISQWSINEYADGRRTGTFQNYTSNDDFQAMVATGLPLRTDDFGSNIGAAHLLSSNSGSFTGIVGSNSDKDYFKLVLTSNSTLRFDATNYATLHPNLDIKLEVFNSSGTLVDSSDIPVTRNSDGTASGLNASISKRLDLGVWYVAISGVGALNPSSTGYSSYSSVGKYSVDYSFTSVVAPAPVIESIASDGSITFRQPQQDLFQTITKYEYSIAGSSNGSSFEFGTWTNAGIQPQIRTFTLGGILNGYTYRVKLRAVEGSTAGDESLASTMYTVPSTPTITTYTYLAGEATVNFSPSTFGGTTNLGYSYSLSTDRGVTWQEWWKYQPNKTLITTSPIYIWNKLSSGNLYKLKIRAENSAGFSGESEIYDIDTRQIPRITSFTPTEGLTGTVIQVRGQDFVDVSSVYFGSVSATYSVSSATLMSITVPSGFTAERITISNPVGSSTSSTAFTLKFPPTISSFTPGTSVAYGVVTISGTNLNETSSVTLNGSVLLLQSKTASTVVVQIPAGLTTGRLVVTTPWGSVTSSTNLIILPPPTIVSFSPDSGKPLDQIQIIGTNFTDVTDVTINGIVCQFTVESSTLITVTVPYGYAQGKIRVVAYAGIAVSTGDFVFRKSD